VTTTLRDFDGGADDPETALIDVGGDHCERLQLLRCPACGTPLNHPRRKLTDPLADHLHETHDPTDFGPSERGERR